MTLNLLSGLFLDIWIDLQQPAVLWQVATIAGCILLGWTLARVLRASFVAQQPEAGFLHLGVASFSRVLTPLLILLLILIARPVLARYHHVNLLRLVIPLLAAFMLIRLSFYLLHRIFAIRGIVSSGLIAFEKFIASLIWLGFALYITDLWPDLIDLLAGIVMPIGRFHVSLLTILQAIGSVAVTLVLALWAGAMLEQRLMRLDSVHSSLRAVMARMARALLVLIAVLFSLSLVGIDLTVLSVFGGALGVGLGLGLQRIVANYVSGFVILLERSMAVGDMVTVDRYYGQVTRINTRYTILRGLDGIESVIPNELFISGPVQNYSLTDRALRLSTHVAIAYDTDIEHVLPLLESATATVERVSRAFPPVAQLVKFGADGLELEIGFWIADPENGRTNVASDVNRAIWQALRSNDIKVPYAQREIRILNEQIMPSSAGDAAATSPAVLDTEVKPIASV